MDRTVKVVPREVEHRAAPAAKACKGAVSSKPCSTNDRPMGQLMPIAATVAESKRLAFRVLRSVERPPDAA